MNTYETWSQVKEEAKLKFCKARLVPFALKEAIERELDQLEVSFGEGHLEWMGSTSSVST